MTPPRPLTTGGKQLAAVATAAIPAVMLSSLALASPAAAAPAPAELMSQGNYGALEAHTVLAAVKARTATNNISAAVVAASVPRAVTAQSTASVKHTVAAGDTVSAIAARYGVSTASVLARNKLSASTIIYPGKVLTISGPKATSSPRVSASTASASYTVRAGDTLGAIAAKHKVSLATVFSLNGLNGRSVIHPGQRIKVGGNAAAAAPSSPAPKAATSGGSSHYVVKAGDTLSAIAGKHRISLATVFSLNGLNGRSVIHPGQKIKVGGNAVSAAPSSPAPNAAPSGSSKKYVIKAGDTLSAIAAKHKVGVSALAAANGISLSTTIFPGRKLTIPGVSAASSGVTPLAPKAPSLPNGQQVPNTFLHYTYPQAVVNDANRNKAALLAAPSPTLAQTKEMVARTAASMGVDPALALAFALQESSFNHQSVSPANAIGTMQVIPAAGQWASDLVGRKLNLLDPQDNVTAGVAIIRALHRGAPNEDIAIAGYYQGQYSVSIHGLYADTVIYVAGIKEKRKLFR